MIPHHIFLGASLLLASVASLRADDAPLRIAIFKADASASAPERQVGYGATALEAFAELAKPGLLGVAA